MNESEAVSLAGKAKIFFRPYAAPPEPPDENYDLWLATGRVLEHWHSGTMTRRVSELHAAMPSAQLYMNARDAEKRGLKENDLAWIESRRGKLRVRVTRQTDAIKCRVVSSSSPGSTKVSSSIKSPWMRLAQFRNRRISRNVLSRSTKPDARGGTMNRFWILLAFL